MQQRTNTPRLPIDSCEALFEKLKWDYTQLENDWSSPYGAFNFVVTAYHLYQDWIKQAGTTEQKERLANIPERGRLLFDVWRDVTNATKHWQLNERSQNKRVVNEVSGPNIGDWHSYFIIGPVLYVRVSDALPSLCELALVTVQCFKWLLGGEGAFEFAALERQLELVFLANTTDQEEIEFIQLHDAPSK